MTRTAHSNALGFVHLLVPLFVIIAIIVAGAGYYAFSINTRSGDIARTKQLTFITSSPVDLAQINNFSKFRSCSGHDYSGTNIDGDKEVMRSMKHYASPDKSLLETNDKLKVFAPFDGTISDIGQSKGRGVGLFLTPSAARGWTFEFGHIQPLDTLSKGAVVTSGDLLGYADVTQGSGGFDLQLYYPKLLQFGFDGLDSFMNHASTDVIASFAEYGFTQSDMIISKDERDESPCKLSGKQDNGDAVFESDLTSDIVVTTKPLTEQTSEPVTNNKTDQPNSTPGQNTGTSECSSSDVAQRPPGCN